MKLSDPSLHCLIYISSASRPLTPEELDSILTKSRKNNRSLDITGMLVYSQGNIIQVLEGSQEAINNLYNRIKSDPRHFGVIMLVNKAIENRSFGEWSMGFRTLGINHMEEIKNICQVKLTEKADEKDKRDRSILHMIRDFAANNM